MNLRRLPEDIMAALRSQRGHNVLVFLAFLAVSTILWWVLALNDEDQCDVRLPVRVTNVPDTVTIISKIPDNIGVSLRTRGSQLLKLTLGRVPTAEIDFRVYRNGNAVRLTDADLKAIARQTLDGASIVVVSPDTLNLAFTTRPGQATPVEIDAVVSPGPRATLTGKPRLSADSVMVFSLNRTDNIISVTTEPIRITSLNETATRRVRIIAPPATRVVPDSIDVTFDVEPLIFKTRKVAIDPVNVPLGHKLITFPAQIEVSYMVPVSVYKSSEPRLRVVADYRSIDRSKPSRNMRIKLVDVSPTLSNVQLASDSVEYIIENL
ncbi:MAG: hypothetical protein Q4C34_02530 [Bacteroidales bacterium]|nr:hypothetical protein [Bacteroidales bacterium]